MATSLAEQLKRLAIPQTKNLVDTKKRLSLLFDASEAAKLSRDEVYEIGRAGLEELIEIDEIFVNFRENLFENESKFMQRNVESREVNKKLDKSISKFLIHLSPYLLLKSSHKALEWLIFRYQIHDLNVKSLFELILPYHESNIFTRILQLMDLDSLEMKQWSWLAPLQKNGLHLPNTVLITHAISDSSFLRFICKLTEKALKVHEKNKSEKKLRTLLGFFASTVVGVLARGKTNDHILTVLLPTLFNGLASKVDDFKSAAFVAIGQLLVNNQLEAGLISKLLELFFEDDSEDSRKKRITLLMIMFQRQQPTPVIPFSKLRGWDWAVPILADFGAENVLVGPLVLAMIEACLKEIFDKNDDNDAEAQVLCWSLADQVLCNDVTACKIFKVIVKYLEEFSSNNAKKMKNDEEEHSASDWLKVLAETFCSKYADIFDRLQDSELQNLRRQYGGEVVDEKLNQQIKALIRKCSGPNHAAAWRQLKPMLWKQIDDHRALRAWLKGSPADEPLTLILLLDRLLRPGSTPEMKKLLVGKVAKSVFGQSNSFVQQLEQTFESKNDLSIPECIKQAISISDYRPGVDHWVAALNDVRNAGHIGWKNPVWLYCFKILIPLITPDAVCNDILNVLDFIPALKIKHQADLIPELVVQIKTKIPYTDLSKFEYGTRLRLKTAEICFKACHSSSRCEDVFNNALDDFVENCFPDVKTAVSFFNTIAGGLPFSSQDSSLISNLLQIYGLHFIWKKIGEKDGQFYEAWMSDLKISVCYLMLALNSQSSAVRRAGVKILRTISKDTLDMFNTLLKELVERRDEIIADADHISAAFYTLLSPEKEVKMALDSKIRTCLAHDREDLYSVINSNQTPFYLATQICILLENVTSAKIMKDLTEFAQRALKTQSDPFIAYAALSSYWNRLNTSNVDCLADKNVWNLAQECLNKSAGKFCPAITFIKTLNKDLFGAMKKKKQEELIQLLVRIRSETENTNVAAAISTVCRKISLNSSIIMNLLEKMTTALPKERDSAPQHVLEKPAWRHGISLLELVQNKKKLNQPEILIQPLFTILKFCLDQEEQAAFEYAKQLVLGLLLQIFQLHVENMAKVDLESSALDVELIVQCLRASPNPQTHHHALLLLACLASLIPVQVMQSIMAIFTFMGSSLTRLDDEHSVQVVVKVVDAIVPVLVQNLPFDPAQGETVVADVLRIFVWTLRDIPQHRRMPLFGRLLSTLDPERASWLFLALLFENYVVAGLKVDKGSDPNMPGSLQLGLDLMLSFGPRVVLQTTLKLIQYLIQIPMERMNPPPGITLTNDNYDPRGLFDVEKHSPKQLRHYTYTLVTFLNTMLSDASLVLQVRELDTVAGSEFENIFKDGIAALLLYAPLCSAQQQVQPNKFWKALETLIYDALDKLATLISSKSLVGVITKLLQSEDTLRRKAVDLLNAHIQAHRGGFTDNEKNSLEEVIGPILNVSVDPSCSDVVRQTALLSIRLLAKVLATEKISLFRNVLIEVCKLCKTKGHLLASAALTVADIVAQIKVHALSELPNFLPPILKALTNFVTAERNDIVLMSLCAALYRIIEVLVAFLTPYYDKIMYVISCLAARWPDIADLNRKILQARQKLSANISHRFLIPALGRVTKTLIEENKLKAIGPLLSLLADSFSACSDVSKLTTDLTPFYLQILQIRSDAADGLIDVSESDVLVIEEYAIDAMLPFVLKLSELSFKPLYYQIFHWSTEHKHRSITFYRLSCKIADRFKGLFVLFAGLFLQNAASLLDSNNVTKTDQPYFGPGDENESKSILLIESIIKTLHSLFIFDSSTFLNKEKFQILVHPLVDQLENTLGGAEKLQERSKSLLTPCLAQMVLATDDTQWKVLNYQLLDKTRSSSPLVRIAALQTIVEMAAKLGEDYLPLLPETIGPLAELFEDEDERVEEAMKEALRRMEEDLGEPIREYFQ